MANAMALWPEKNDRFRIRLVGSARMACRGRGALATHRVLDRLGQHHGHRDRIRDRPGVDQPIVPARLAAHGQQGDGAGDDEGGVAEVAGPAGRVPSRLPRPTIDGIQIPGIAPAAARRRFVDRGGKRHRHDGAAEEGQPQGPVVGERLGVRLGGRDGPTRGQREHHAERNQSSQAPRPQHANP